MNQMTAPSIMRLFDTTKEERVSFVNDVIVRMDEVNPLDLHLQVKCLEDIISQLKDHPQYKSAIMDAADKYPGKKFSYRHAEISKMEAGVKYNYLMCGDAEYDRLDAELKSVKAKLDERAKFLQSIPASGLETVDAVTGEVVKLYPPTKTSTSTIAVKLK